MQQAAQRVSDDSLTIPAPRYRRRKVKIDEANPTLHTGYFFALTGGTVEDREGRPIKDPRARGARLIEMRSELWRVYRLTRREILSWMAVYRQKGGPGRINTFLCGLINASIEASEFAD